MRSSSRRLVSQWNSAVLGGKVLWPKASFPKIGKALPIALAVFIALIQACAPATTSLPAAIPGDSTTGMAADVPVNDENPSAATTDFMPLKSLWLTREDALALHKEPDIHSAQVTVLPQNTILFFGGERQGENTTLMTKGKSYTGDWLKVKSIDPEAIGWLFVGRHHDSALATEVGVETMVTESEKAGRIIAPITNWSSHETAQSLEIKAIENSPNGYSGFYQFKRSPDGVQEMDGRFWVSTWDDQELGKLKITCYGEYAKGKPLGDMVAEFIQGDQKETVWLSFDAKGKFTGRRYELEKAGKVTSRYSDLVENLGRDEILMD